MQDRPSAGELLEAVAAFLSNEVAPAFQGRRRFHALVAANVARIVARETRLAPSQLERECRDLWALLGKKGEVDASVRPQQLAVELNSELCRIIAAGDADADPMRARVLDHLRSVVTDKLRIDNPKLAQVPVDHDDR